MCTLANSGQAHVSRVSCSPQFVGANTSGVILPQIISALLCHGRGHLNLDKSLVPKCRVELLKIFMLAVLQDAESRPTQQALAGVKMLEETAAAVVKRWEVLK